MKLPNLFNPSNDMALASHVREYVPPKRIQQMEADLEALAAVWEGTMFSGPWGWSLATKRRYERMGVPVELLPSDDWIEEVRKLSSREYACEYIKELLEEFQDERLLGDGMFFCKDVSTLNSQLSTVNCHLIFKSPWSSSGRGVFVDRMADGKCQMSTLKRLQGFLSSQGGFVVDRFYENKVLDFAMEFFVHEDHTVEFLGWSVFHAGENGAYGYNYVESQEELLRRIDTDENLLLRLIEYHKEHLAKTAYHGPVGIDMLKTADGSIHPCLEINLRMNMGILALLLHEQYGSNATVALTPEREHGFQAQVDEGRLMITFRS
ncbi:MAG: hypothetical protein II549_01205 [Bacteroidaceae bacterium]|nr:hypothetical protein [Bacteroidaceae bacterium]